MKFLFGDMRRGCSSAGFSFNQAIGSMLGLSLVEFRGLHSCTGWSWGNHMVLRFKLGLASCKTQPKFYLFIYFSNPSFNTYLSLTHSETFKIYSQQLWRIQFIIINSNQLINAVYSMFRTSLINDNILRPATPNIFHSIPSNPSHWQLSLSSLFLFGFLDPTCKQLSWLDKKWVRVWN